MEAPTTPQSETVEESLTKPEPTTPPAEEKKSAAKKKTTAKKTTAKKEESPAVHIVRHDDDILTIANEHSTSPGAIKALNGFKAGHIKLKVGQEVKVR